MNKLNILVVNDDGINAKGIKLLAGALTKYGNVIVCAPDSGRSACAHAIVLHGTLSFDFVERKDSIDWYVTDAMPADCVRLALDLLDTKFDVVFSGVNSGQNLGTDIIYSGTVSAAREAHIEYVPAVAVSTDFDAWEIVENELEYVLDMVFNKKLYSKDYVLNINFPNKPFTKSAGFATAFQGVKRFKTAFLKNNEGRYINTDSDIVYDTREGSDVYLAEKGYTTFVPLRVEQTSYDYVEEIKNKLN